MSTTINQSLTRELEGISAFGSSVILGPQDAVYVFGGLYSEVDFNGDSASDLGYPNGNSYFFVEYNLAGIFYIRVL